MTPLESSPGRPFAADCQLVEEGTSLSGISVARPDWNPWIVRTVLLLAAVMCLYIGATVWAVRGDLKRAMEQLPLGVVPGMLGLVLLGLSLRAVRWLFYVRRLGWNVRPIHSLVAFIASFAFTATPGKAGEVVKSVLLRTRYDIPLADGVGVLLVERIGDLLAVLLLAAGGLGLLAHSWVYFLGVLLLVGAITVFVSAQSIHRPVLLRIAKTPRLSAAAHKILRLLETGRVLLRPFPFSVGVGLAVIAWGCEAWAFHLLIQAFGVGVHFLTSCSIYGIATVVGALSALPGGLGSFEVIMVLLLARVGMPVGAATLPVVLFRFSTLWFGSVLGLAFMLGWLSCIAKADVRQVPGGTK